MSKFETWKRNKDKKAREIKPNPESELWKNDLEKNCEGKGKIKKNLYNLFTILKFDYDYSSYFKIESKKFKKYRSFDSVTRYNRPLYLVEYDKISEAIEKKYFISWGKKTVESMIQLIVKLNSVEGWNGIE